MDTATNIRRIWEVGAPTH